MKKLINSIVILSVITLVATSCSKDEDPTYAPPVIKNLEIGEGHHHEHHSVSARTQHGDGEAIAHIGEDMHMEADITAEGKIAYIMIEIHNEKTGAEVVEKKFTEGFVGLKNTNFHKHIDIPATAAEGDYHFHIKVVDQQGQETEVEKELELKKEEE